ncbi:MAG: hypothetical protein QGH90_02870 [Candidatus Poseidoniaceae archaeon]|jgi:hypothetical protein|nr:hypothetical protein [Candidatus Poseidoniaceae archaeon]MDP7000822.1 hypothetical protein [Candidatus Poseidoniaceae archaeon]
MTVDEEKSEITVNVEVRNDSSKNMIIAAVIIVIGIGIALSLFGGESSGIFGGDAGGISGTCGDGIDNDGGGQADRDDPDCYHEPEIWKGYDADRKEIHADNDPLHGRP